MSRRTERSYKADRTDELALHSKVRCSVLQVDDPAVPQEFTSLLLREICARGTPATAGASVREDRRADTEVSRGHSSEVGPSPRPELVSRGSIDPALPETMTAKGRVCAQRSSQHEHGTSSTDLLERILQMTARSRGVSMRRLLTGLRRYVVGWVNYFAISQAYRVIPELDQWVRRRVRLCYWKQWKRPRTRRRHLIRLGIPPAEVAKASRSRRGYWWMAGTSLVQRALNNRWLAEQGVPSLRQHWVELHYGKRNPQFNPAAVNLTGTA